MKLQGSFCVSLLRNVNVSRQRHRKFAAFFDFFLDFGFLNSYIPWHFTRDGCIMDDLAAENGAVGGYFYPVGAFSERIFPLSFAKQEKSKYRSLSFVTIQLLICIILFQRAYRYPHINIRVQCIKFPLLRANRYAQVLLVF
jgi:hypothetical protein